ncbi:MAG: TIGR02588 family protein [Cyanobacteriota bacterium]|nr:TIGR02588 family protein [Cyanobacteriota bacterium]
MKKIIYYLLKRGDFKAQSFGNIFSEHKHHKKSRSIAEWISLSVAILIVIIILSLILYSWHTQENKPPIFSVKIENEVREVGQEFYVPFIVKNTGGETAQSVQVVGQLKMQDEMQEIGEQYIDFLSGGAAIKGVFVFSHHPKEGKLTIRVASYKLP